MNVIQTNSHLPIDCFGLPRESIEAIKKESRNGTVLYDLCCGEQNPKLSLGLPTEIICMIMGNLEYLDAVKISKTIECDNEANKITLAVQRAASRSINCMSSYCFKWSWDNKKLDAGKFLLRHYFRDLPSPADRNNFFFTLANCCTPSPDLLSYILEAIPEETPSLDICAFERCLEPKHIDTITRRFACLKTIPLPWHPLEMGSYQAACDEAIRKIANNPNFQNLTKLELKESAGSALAFIANSPYMTNLETLTIFRPKSGINEGLKAFFQSRFVKKLHKLELSFFHEYTDMLTDDTFSLLANCENFQKLKVLKFQTINLTDSIVENLVNSQNLSNLEELLIYQCERLTERSVAVIAKSKQMSHLKLLLFSTDDININLDMCLQAIAESSFMGRLESLSFFSSSSVYSKRGITCIADSPFMVNLKKLNLETNTAQIDSENAHRILRESKFTNQCIFCANWKEMLDYMFS